MSEIAYAPMPRQARRSALAPPLLGYPPTLTLAHAKRLHILSVMVACEGNKTRAAASLGVTYKGLLYMLRGIDRAWGTE